LEGLKGWNPSALVLESAQAREDRKKRKELKKLAKAQGILPGASTSTLGPPATPAVHPQTATTAAADAPTPSSTIPTPNIKPSIPRPTSRPTLPPVQVPPPRVGTPGGRTPVTGTPTSAAPRTAGVGVNGIPGDKRGKKRDHEEARGLGQGGTGAVPVNGNVNGPASGGGNVPKAVVNAKAGVAGARPRPIKKQRMDIQGQARDVTVPVQQQPTPQGV